MKKLAIGLAIVVALAGAVGIASAIVTAPGGSGALTCINNCSGATFATGCNSTACIITTASAATPMTFNFPSAWATAPVCVVQNQTTAGAFVEKVSTTTVEFIVTTAITPGTADLFSVLCFGQ